jgi:hypothetical protein
MIKKNSPTLIFILFLFLTSCTTKEVNLRIRNTSPYTYDSVVVNTTGSENTYGTIAPGTASDYKVFDYAYSYAHISLYIDTAHYQLIPIDYVGEQKLKSGNYTYEVSVYDTVNRQLVLMLVED